MALEKVPPGKKAQHMCTQEMKKLHESILAKHIHKTHCFLK